MWLVVKEFFCPWLRLARIERELDAEERVGALKMEIELWERESKRLLEEFYRAPFYEAMCCNDPKYCMESM